MYRLWSVSYTHLNDSHALAIPPDFSRQLPAMIPETVQGCNSSASKFLGRSTDPAVIMRYNGPQPPDKDHEYYLQVWATKKPLPGLNQGFWLNELLHACLLYTSSRVAGPQWWCTGMRILRYRPASPVQSGRRRCPAPISVHGACLFLCSFSSCSGLDGYWKPCGLRGGNGSPGAYRGPPVRSGRLCFARCAVASERGHCLPNVHDEYKKPWCPP